MRPDINDFTTSEQRFREIAAILAAGILRLHARAALHAPISENLPKTDQDCLDVSAETVLTVHGG